MWLRFGRWRARAPGVGVALLVAAPIVLAAGCLENPGVDPPAGELNFPTALALADIDADGTPDRLLVANSNFDLRYNAGTLQSYDVQALLGCAAVCHLEDDCVMVPSGSGGTGGLVLHPSDAQECQNLLVSEVLTGSFASGMALSPTADRVYLVVRSDSNLAYIDLDANGTLACGGEPGSRHRCDDAHRGADDTVASDRGISRPLDPVGLYVDDSYASPSAGIGNYVVAAYRGGSAALFVEKNGVPNFVDAVSTLPSSLQSITRQPSTGLGWMASSTLAAVGRVGVASAPDGLHSQLFNAGPLYFPAIDTGASGFADARAIAFDPVDDQRAYVLGRSPQALMVVDLAETGNVLAVDDVIDVCVGASRLNLANIGGHTVAFVSCFNEGSMYTIDVERQRLLGVTSGLSGPFVMAIDEADSKLFLSDFTTSVVRILSLEPVAACLADGSATGASPSECTPTTEAILGIPRPKEQLR